MAATANNIPASSSSSPRSPTKAASPPWIQVVRGPEPEPIANPNPVSPSYASSSAENTSAWNKKPAAESSSSASAAAATVVMGAEQWPSLSECTKASPKMTSSLSDSSIIIPHFGSSLSLEVPGTDVSSTTTVWSPSSTTQKPATSYLKQHGQPGRQKSFKRDAEANPQANNGVLSHQSSQPHGDGSYYHHTHGSPKPNTGSHSDGRDNVQTHSNREAGQRNPSGDHPLHRSSFKKGNGGPQSRGDGSHQTYGGRRSNQERGNHDWNPQKSFNGRDASLQPTVVSRGFVRPPPVAAPFVHHPPVQPFINPMMPDLPIFYLPPGMQFVAPVPPMYFPAPDPELYTEIMKQINYYFSNDNLVRDTFLRQKMDGEGWVSVDVISKFNKVKKLTNDTFQILEAVRASTVVEVQGDKIRKRDDWLKWVMPTTVQFPTLSDSQSPKGSPVSGVTEHIQSVSLDEKTSDPTFMKDAVAGSAPTLQASSGDSSAALTSVDEAYPGGC